METKKFIINEIKKLHRMNILEQEKTVVISQIKLLEEGVSSVGLADKLVSLGVIKDEFTDLSGKKASSKLSFMIDGIMGNDLNEERKKYRQYQPKVFGTLPQSLVGKEFYTKDEVKQILNQLTKKVDTSAGYRIYDLEDFLGIYEIDQ